MAEIKTHSNLPHIPDDISLPHFMLEYHHPLRPTRTDVACLIEDTSGRKIYLEELRNNTRALASTLHATYGLGEDDVVMISSYNHIDYATALWAVHLLGGVVSCSNPQCTVGELHRQLKLAKITFVIAHSSNVSTVLCAMRLAGLSSDRAILIDRMASHPSVPRILNVYDCIQEGVKNNFDFQGPVFGSGEARSKIALLSWSSGTTGKPKAVAISHYALIANIIQMASHSQVEKANCFRNTRGFRPGDVAIGVLPFYHVAGLMISLHLTLFCAMSVVVIEKYNILSTLESIVRHRITHLILVPPLAVELCKHPAVRNHDLSGVKHMIIGAAPVPKEIQVQLCELFPDAQIGQAYGLTEMTTTLAMMTGTQKRGIIGSGGRLLPGLHARVIRQDGSLAEYGEPGELVVKGPAIALGYLNDHQATRDTFVDGWVHTGDQVIISETHEVFVIDRLKEMIKVKGFQVAPAELEGCLLSHSYIADCCVVGMPDEYSGEVPLAFVVLTPDAQARFMSSSYEAYNIKHSIFKHVADRLSSYKRLRGVEIVKTIPKNGSGKLLRRVLCDRVKEQIAQRKCRPRL